MNPSVQPWFHIRHPRPQAEFRLFCFPYAGGRSVIYKDWGRHLTGAEVAAVELPGRGRRRKEPACRRLPPLIEDLSAAMLPYLDRPFAFFGHSLGALIAFETALYLRKHCGRTPVHLVVSAKAAPHLTEKVAEEMTDAEFLQLLKLFQGTPPEVLEDTDLMAFLLPAIRADFEIHNSYRCGPFEPLDCPITALGGTEDPLVSREAVEAWRPYTAAYFSTAFFQGGHFYLNAEKDLLLKVLQSKLEPYATGTERHTVPQNARTPR